MKARWEQEDKEFFEEWTQNYPDMKAYRQVIEFYYNGGRIDDFIQHQSMGIECVFHILKLVH